ncbi:hypothetical protein [Kozakia baliensis]|uniref:hypothetical protein n=1 Tax=Kozakia baliensis TaxID=153496 RepID=UPI000497FED7|nr:hypothetical protein [Kozakia baliensis]
MADAISLETELKKAQERVQKERLAIQKIKRAMAKRKRAEKRNIEAQALCALGRGVVEFCDDNSNGNHASAVVDFLRMYLTRESDVDAIIFTLSSKRVADAVRVPKPAMPSIEIVD